MSHLHHTLALVTLGLALTLNACDDNVVDPNEIGGETNLELTQVGGRFSASLQSDTYVPGFSSLEDSVVITKNDNGIVTTHVQATFDSNFVVTLDSVLGTTSLPWSTKFDILNADLERFDATLDTTNKQAMKVTFDLKLKVTSEGIQDFVNSHGDLSHPYTIVKYDAAVGDKYEFTDSKGVKTTRTVTYRSTTDDYPIAFWNIKIIKVEQTREDPMIEKIIYYTNHKFGLVGVELHTKTGKVVKLGIIPPTL